MASRTFTIRTEPHDVTIGDTVLLFQPEAVGADFLSQYSALTEAQKAVGGRPEDASIEGVTAVTEALNGFIKHFLMPESVEVFEALSLPTRVSVQLAEFLAEVYGGGAEERPTTPSGGSARPSAKRGSNS